MNIYTSVLSCREGEKNLQGNAMENFTQGQCIRKGQSTLRMELEKNCWKSLHKGKLLCTEERIWNQELLEREHSKYMCSHLTLRYEVFPPRSISKCYFKWKFYSISNALRFQQVDLIERKSSCNNIGFIQPYLWNIKRKLSMGFCH